MGLTPKSKLQVDSSLCTCLGPPVICLMCISVSATAVNGLIFHLHSPGCSITAEPWSCPLSSLPSQNSSCCWAQSPDSSSLRLVGKFRCGYKPPAPNPAGQEQWGAPPAPGAGSGQDSSLCWEMQPGGTGLGGICSLSSAGRDSHKLVPTG